MQLDGSSDSNDVLSLDDHSCEGCTEIVYSGGSDCGSAEHVESDEEDSAVCPPVETPEPVESDRGDGTVRPSTDERRDVETFARMVVGIRAKYQRHMYSLNCSFQLVDRPSEIIAIFNVIFNLQKMDVGIPVHSQHVNILRLLGEDEMTTTVFTAVQFSTKQTGGEWQAKGMPRQ